jgi:hypothetical protein
VLQLLPESKSKGASTEIAEKKADFQSFGKLIKLNQ